MSNLENDHRLCLLLFFCAITLINPIAECQAVPGDVCWSDDFHLPGLSSIARAFALYEGDVIVGGSFTHVEQTRVDYIARYDGENWSPMGDGFDNIVMDAINYDGQLIVCGYFDASGGSPLNHVARWNGTSWEPMGVGLPSGKEILIEYNGDLYCESYRWNGSYWAEAFDVDGSISAMEVHNGHLVVTGNLTGVDGLEVDYIFAWNGSQTEALYQGEENALTDLKSVGGILYATTSHTISPPSLVKSWSEDHWQIVGELHPHMNTRCTDLVAYQDELVLAQRSASGGISSYISLRRWDGTDWHNLGGFPGDTPLTLFPYENGMLIGGNLCKDDFVISANLLFWEDDVGHALFSGAGQGLNGASQCAYSLASGPEGLAIGGRFRTAGQTVTASIALWDGDVWQERSLFNTEFTLPTALYWSGDFLGAVAYPFSDYIYYCPIWWEEGAWHTGVECQPIEQFFTWQGLVLGAGSEIYQVLLPQFIIDYAQVDGRAYCLSEWNGKLVAGGEFTAVGGVPANGVALYNGTNWTNAGTGIDGHVKAVVHYGGLLIAAGSFDQAGSTPAASIAAWDGLAWYAMGDGFDNVVRALAVFNGQLIAGGSFHASGETAVNHIARWDGLQWQPLGSGTDEYVCAMEEYNGRLYIVGYFSFAGGKPASGITSWYDPSVTAVQPGVTMPSPPAQIVLNSAVPNPFNPITTLSFELDRQCQVQLSIYDMAGRLVKQLLIGEQDAGRHQVRWMGHNTAGQRMPSGSYVVRLSVDQYVQSKKVMLLY